MPKVLEQLSKLDSKVVMSIDRDEYYKYAPLADMCDNLTLLIRKGQWVKVDGEFVWVNGTCAS